MSIFIFIHLSSSPLFGYFSFKLSWIGSLCIYFLFIYLRSQRHKSRLIIVFGSWHTIHSHSVLDYLFNIKSPCKTISPTWKLGPCQSSSNHRISLSSFSFPPSPWGHHLHFLFKLFILCCCWVTRLCLTLCDPMDCSPPASSVHEVLPARILEWVAISVSKESWSGLPRPLLEDLPNPGIKPPSLMSPTSVGRFFTTSATYT